MTAIKENIVNKFYTAFANADAAEMCKCYHPDIKFRDPVFGLLKGKEVCQMWEMLIKRSKDNINIVFSEVEASDYLGSAQWIATYNFSKTNRKVVTIIQAKFHLQNGLIIKHIDEFDIWKWSKQAFDIVGYLLGWTGYFQKKIQEQALLSLNKYNETTKK